MKTYKGIVIIECGGKTCQDKLKNVRPACADCKNSKVSIVNLNGVKLKNLK